MVDAQYSSMAPYYPFCNCFIVVSINGDTIHGDNITGYGDYTVNMD